MKSHALRRRALPVSAAEHAPVFPPRSHRSALLQRTDASQSLEELAFIVEVLEEDLRTGSSRASSLPPSRPPQSPNWSPAGLAGNTSEECDEMIPSPESYLSSSPGAAEYQPVISPRDLTGSSLQVSGPAGAGRRRQVWAEPPSPDGNLDASCFFWTQLQKEESVLGGIADTVLLHTDGRGRTYAQVSCGSGS